MTSIAIKIEEVITFHKDDKVSRIWYKLGKSHISAGRTILSEPSCQSSCIYYSLLVTEIAQIHPDILLLAH